MPQKFQDMGHVLELETDISVPRYAFHKPFTVNFPSKCEWLNGLKPDRIYLFITVHLHI